MLAQEDKLVEAGKKILSKVTGGFTTSLTTTLTDELSKKIVKDAEPIVRNLVNEERNRVADAALQGIPYLAGGAFAAIGTAFIIPKSLLVGKLAGYAASSALLGFGAYSFFSKISTKASAPPPPPAPTPSTTPAPQPVPESKPIDTSEIPGAEKLPEMPKTPSLPQLPEVDTAALKAEMSVKIVKDAEPFIRQLVQEERSRLGNALEAGVPFHIAAALSLVGTLFLVPAERPFLKTAGYSAATVLAGIGLWRTFDRMKTG